MKCLYVLLFIVHYGISKKYHQTEIRASIPNHASTDVTQSHDASPTHSVTARSGIPRRVSHARRGLVARHVARVRSGIPRRLTHVPLRQKNVTSSKRTAKSKEKIGEKRNGIFSSMFDESQEFGKDDVDRGARRSDVFRKNDMMMPYPQYNNPMTPNVFPEKSRDDDDEPEDSDDSFDMNNRNGGGRDDIPSMNAPLPPASNFPSPMEALGNFRQFPSFPNPMPDDHGASYRRGPFNMEEPPTPYGRGPLNMEEPPRAYGRSNLNMEEPPRAYGRSMDVAPRYPTPRRLIPKVRSNLPGNPVDEAQHRIDNEIDNLMMRLAQEQIPTRSSLSAPRDTLESPTPSSLPNNPYIPFNPGLPDHTVVPTLESSFAPQGVMQLGPRPLDPRFFGSASPPSEENFMDGFYHHNMMGSNFMQPPAPQNNRRRHRPYGNRRRNRPVINSNMFPTMDDSVTPNIMSPPPASSFYDNDNDNDYRSMYRTPRKRHRRRKPKQQFFNQPPPDVNAMSHIFDAIDSDERGYKKKYGGNLPATRKNFVSRYRQRGSPRANGGGNYQRGFPPADDGLNANPYEYVPNSGDNVQNDLEGKYRMVLKSMFDNNNNNNNNNNYARNVLPMGTMNSGNMFSETNFAQPDRFVNDNYADPMAGNYEFTDKRDVIWGIPMR